MEHTPAQDLVKKLKEIKARDEITYPRIMERIERNGRHVSLTTLRRVFADGSDANSFNYETTLLPIAEALLNEEEATPSSPEIDGLKAVIRVQVEEIARLHEMKEHLEERITFLLSQIELKDKRMDEKDALINKLLEKVL